MSVTSCRCRAVPRAPAAQRGACELTNAPWLLKQVARHCAHALAAGRSPRLSRRHTGGGRRWRRRIIAALLALGAAFFIAIGDVIHQRSAHEVTDEPVGHLQLFRKLLRDRQWWLGSAVAAIGFALQAAALGLGSVLLVQALLVTSLLFALPMSARLSHRRVTRWEWMWAALLAASGRGHRHRR